VQELLDLGFTEMFEEGDKLLERATPFRQ